MSIITKAKINLTSLLAKLAWTCSELVFSLKDTSRQLTAAFHLIHHADPLSSPLIITQLYTTVDIALPTCSQPRPCSSEVSDSTLPPPHQPSGCRLPNISLIWLAGGTAGGLVELSVILHNEQLKMEVNTGQKLKQRLFDDEGWVWLITASDYSEPHRTMSANERL